MKLESRRTIHVGINLVFAPAPVVDRPSARRFQDYLDDSEIPISQANYPGQLVLFGEAANPLQITVAALGPPAGQLIIVSQQPSQIDRFCSDAEKIMAALDRTWPAPVRQLLAADATIRDLYESGEHAFKELWESTLHQNPASLQTLGADLLGGGLRFVLPAADSHYLTPLKEVKIESYLQDTTKLFLEAQFVWHQQVPQGESFEITRRLQELDDYIKNQVVKFVQEGQE